MENGTLEHVEPVADEIGATLGLLLRVWTRAEAGERPDDALDAVLAEECAEAA